ncbi:hypothetical protein CAPTEDRAFT_194701 [Capitella teleta]|uniref:Uncharacterized protein n=1 Tax=Capitella teleta TaxID=283909 RepID=R7VLK9_CAPTE|nr:hypothetical protein CAPTEDRAFT_194701 [Capitella teleta]|eukprot:ELU17675.1 hypothetical protein CAPTEDRAFT_194701 [Capitella teleta]
MVGTFKGAMKKAKPPLHEALTAFLMQYRRMPTATDTAENRQVKYLLLWAGREGRQITDSWTLTEDEKKKLKPYWDRFKKHVQPKSKFRLARHQLRSTRQLKGEPVDVSVRILLAIGKDCEYDELDEQLIDALIFGLNSATVQKKLLQKDKDLTFEQAITTARLEEATLKQMEGITNPLQVNEVKKDYKKKKKRTLRRKIQCKLDTGAEGNVMSKETFVQNFGPLQQLKRSPTRIIAYGGHTVQNYGMCTLSDVFQKLIHDTFADQPGVTGIANDIVIVGFQEDGSDHDQNFQAVMKRARERNIKFNEEKLILKQRSIPFYGHVITDQELTCPVSQQLTGMTTMQSNFSDVKTPCAKTLTEVHTPEHH